MRAASWYVIQVQTGKESAVVQRIQSVCRSADDAFPEDGSILLECFSPRYAYQCKRGGEWIRKTMPLLPGYVIAVTNDPWGLRQTLGEVPEFTRLLTMGSTFAPLNEDEKSWIERWTLEGDRTIPMSFAHKEGDKIVVTKGPLKGQEAMIERINRRKNVAHLEIHAGQITIHTTVGLAVMPGKAGK